MSKAYLIDELVKGLNTSKAQAGKMVDVVLDGITKSLKKGKSISLIGFGTFTVRKRAARAGRNPQTGKTIQIKARKVAVFKAGKALKNAVK